MGAYHGRWGFETFSHRKAVLRGSPTRPDPNLLYPPYNKLKERLMPGQCSRARCSALPRSVPSLRSSASGRPRARAELPARCEHESGRIVRTAELQARASRVLESRTGASGALTLGLLAARACRWTAIEGSIRCWLRELPDDRRRAGSPTLELAVVTGDALQVAVPRCRPTALVANLP